MSETLDTVDLKARLARLTPGQRAALAARLGTGAEPRRAAPLPFMPCPARATAGEGPLVVPASSAQRRMWFLQRYAPDSPAYNTAKQFRLHGPLDGALLERALQALAARHETLRTTFELRGSEVMQVVALRAEFRLETADLSGLAMADQEAQLAGLAGEWARRGFDLERGPLWRVGLVRLGAVEHALVVVVHHIVFDGWSLGVLCRELGSLYGSLLAGRPPELPELRVQYADFAHWQERFLSGHTLTRLTDYWRRNLQDAPPALELPTDRARPAVESLQGANRFFVLPRALRAELAALALREEVTLFMVLMAAFKVLLFRHSQQDDVTVGVPFANRNPRETEALIGCFLNTLPLRTGLAGNPTFAELLQRVKQTTLEAHDHAELPFESLVQLLPTGRDLSRSPWFQHFFQLRNVPRERIEAGPVRSEMKLLTNGTTKFTLSLHVDELDGELACDWEYDTALFDAETIDRLAARWETLLRGAIARPDARLAELPLLPAAERGLLAEWNRTAAEFPREQCVHHLFEEQAARTPEAVAVVLGDQRLTYRELNARAEQLARHLGGIGVGPETPVGVCVERSLEMVVALLGVLKAGGAYVPLDPLYPQERLAYIVADSGARVVLTQTTLRGRLPEAGLEWVILDTALPAAAAGQVVLPPVKPDQIAYVIYTSGSTGRPKGVEIQHASVVNFLCDLHRRLGLTAADALLSVTSICFDISVLELFLPLTVGARVVVCPDAVKGDGVALIAELERHRITCLQATPASWRLLLGAGWHGDGHLLALCGGEALAEDLATALLPRCRLLWNLYGPTETTIWSTATVVRPGESVSIGRPLANTQTHILDAHGQPVPVGVPGELFIGGNGLARGYRNRPDLTAERFIPCPPELGEGRMYRTGDRCRWRASGDIEFLGRLDHQIKLRGFRVEPGEIETLLRQQPHVHDAAVLVREDAPGDARLVAYVTAESAIDAKVLRAALAQRLPEHMIPAAFVRLAGLPLTPNGKLDRKALPKPEPNPELVAGEISPPKSLLEQRLVELWKQTLGIPNVPPDGDFFALGGHSLLAVRLMLDIGAMLGRNVPIATLFHAPTPAGMARLLTERHWQPAWASLLPLQTRGSRPPLFYVHGYGGGIWGAVSLSKHLGTDQPLYGLQAARIEDQRWQHATVEEMAASYVQEIRAFQPGGPYQLVGVSLGGMIAYEVARQLEAQGQPIGLLVVLDSFVHNLPGRRWLLRSTPREVHDRFRPFVGPIWKKIRAMSPVERRRYLARHLCSLGAHFQKLHPAKSLPPVGPEAETTTPAPNGHDHFDLAVRRYLPQPCRFPVLLFRSQTPTLRVSAAWRYLARGKLTILPVHCTHNEIPEEPHIGYIAAELRRHLA
ncbi:MAG: non-ribosomal peptide synthetase [Pedosphaera sp. Tous-C6FEB]|nr:MAG: non-ribosomal peptide synthetase [Pedosphaera sp. Tous-C6FEB]